MFVWKIRRAKPKQSKKCNHLKSTPLKLEPSSRNSRRLQEFTKKLSHGILESTLVESVKFMYIEWV